MEHEIVIKRRQGLSSIDFKELWSYRELLYFLAWRDIKLRYKQTVIGVGWAILQPFLMMVVFSIIFGRIAGVPSDSVPYPIFSFTGLLLWNIFSNSLSNSSQSLISSASIIQKVYLPRILLPTASVIVTLVDFLFAGIIFIGILIYYNFTPNLIGILLIIPMIIFTLISSLGMGFFLSALNVKFRDVRYALPFFIQLLIFMTPVIYPISITPLKYQWIIALNPMTGIIESFRTALLYETPVDWNLLTISVVMGMILFVFGVWYFLRTEKTFADVI